MCVFRSSFIPLPWHKHGRCSLARQKDTEVFFKKKNPYSSMAYHKKAQLACALVGGLQAAAWEAVLNRL